MFNGNVYCLFVNPRNKKHPRESDHQEKKFIHYIKNIFLLNVMESRFFKIYTRNIPKSYQSTEAVRPVTLAWCGRALSKKAIVDRIAHLIH